MIEASYDNGRTWVSLSRWAAAVAFAGRKSGARFMAWLRAGYIVEAGGVEYRIARQELDTNE